MVSDRIMYSCFFVCFRLFGFTQLLSSFLAKKEVIKKVCKAKIVHVAFVYGDKGRHFFYLQNS